MENVFLSLNVLKEYGYVRKKCAVCGTYFWTLNPEAKTCSEPPCGEYQFIGERRYRVLEINSIRNAFLKFFERNGHTLINRYPVVARWREDVYFVGASIYNFQPHVVSGLVPPPANPLAISQPCIRLTDLDKIGRSGKHLTSFEMMAHHAFSIQGREKAYWIEDMVRYCLEFFGKELKIPLERVVLKEGLWQGGGNAGENFEVIIDGLEVATLVAMHYKEVDGKLVEMGNKIVDTGYGLERIAWLLNGRENVYEASLRSIVDLLRSRVNWTGFYDDVLKAVSRKLHILAEFTPENYERVVEAVSRELGRAKVDVARALNVAEKVYSISDHVRTVTLMVNDGVVPSNVKAGYLARLLIRRIFRSLHFLGAEPWDEVLAVLVEGAIGYFKDFIPEVEDVRDVLLSILENEKRKYEEVLKKGERIAKKLKKEYGGKKLPVSVLVEVYDSYGVPPDFVKEQLAGEVEVVVPPDFYAMVAERHQKAAAEKREEEDILAAKVQGLPDTEVLYYSDISKFQAKVVGVIDERYVVLDRTAFYPTSGGQMHDTGVLKGDGKAAKVLNVLKVGGVVLHEVDKAVFSVGDSVVGEVDWERRKQLTRGHTATHIVLASARKVLGKHVWQAGAEKDVDECRLDITHYKHLTDEEVRRIELEANKIVSEDLPVKVREVDRNEAERKYGFVLYQGGVVPAAKIRVVEIEGVDAQACGGTHCKRTGEVGLIKIVRAERIQDGVERLIFKVGPQAVSYVQQRLALLKEILGAVKAPEDKVLEELRAMAEQAKQLRQKVRRLKDELVARCAEDLARKVRVVDGLRVVVAVVELELGRDDLAKLGSILQEKFGVDAAVLVRAVEGAFELVAMLSDEGVKALGWSSEIAREASRVLGGKGGGKKDIGFGGGPLKVDKRIAEREVLEVILKRLSQ